MSLECPVCGKIYQRKKSYEKHLGKHSAVTSKSNEVSQSNRSAQKPVESNSWAELPDGDIATDLPFYLLYTEDEEVVDDLTTTDSLPNCPDYEPPPKTKKRSEGEKPSRKSLKPFVVSCGICKKNYVSLDGYIKHSYTHRTDIYAKPPELVTVQAESTRIAGEVLKDIVEFNSKNAINGERIIADVNLLVSQLNSEKSCKFFSCVCESLFECFKDGGTFVMPSQIRDSFVRNAAMLMADLDQRSRLMCKLIQLLHYPEHKLDVLLTAIVRRFSQKIIAFILHWLVHGEGSPIVKFSSLHHVSDQSTDSLEFKQIMHYVGGANVKKVLKNCLRLKVPTGASERIVDIINSSFIVGDGAEEPSPVLMSWTVSQDRGKLIKISSPALDFFVALGKTVQDLEHVDGSLWIDEVIERVLQSPHLVFLWDNIVKGSLPKEESFQLLYSLCHHFCVTWRNGIISRRMDQINRARCKTDKFGKGGVAFRAKLA